mgnify:CR=1 FL=1
MKTLNLNFDPHFEPAKFFSVIISGKETVFLNGLAMECKGSGNLFIPATIADEVFYFELDTDYDCDGITKSGIKHDIDSINEYLLDNSMKMIEDYTLNVSTILPFFC